MVLVDDLIEIVRICFFTSMLIAGRPSTSNILGSIVYLLLSQDEAADVSPEYQRR
jgi:hypothetical protein